MSIRTKYKKITSYLKKNQKSIKYVVTGIVSWINDTTVLLILTTLISDRYVQLQPLFFPIFLPNAISTLVGSVTSFVLNKYFVFGNKGEIMNQSYRYVTILVFNYFLHNLIFNLIYASIQLSEILIKMIVTILQATWTFYFFKHFVFISRSNKHKF
ncbi:MAG: GtrA family protein [Candidatus Dojkabacteria bacterium]|nr:GtrA family protein [Candidatus Dojkabacteria bacterium]